jgi:hypothetical protein
MRLDWSIACSEVTPDEKELEIRELAQERSQHRGELHGTLDGKERAEVEKIVPSFRAA